MVKAAQPFRPHVLDMFEPQDHPDDIPYPGGPPTRPYDNAGWTLAYQMGVKFDRISMDSMARSSALLDCRSRCQAKRLRRECPAGSFEQ